jgi:hypothetical protein
MLSEAYFSGVEGSAFLLGEFVANFRGRRLVTSPIRKPLNTKSPSQLGTGFLRGSIMMFYSENRVGVSRNDAFKSTRASASGDLPRGSSGYRDSGFALFSAERTFGLPT